MPKPTIEERIARHAERVAAHATKPTDRPLHSDVPTPEDGTPPAWHQKPGDLPPGWTRAGDTFVEE